MEQPNRPYLTWLPYVIPFVYFLALTALEQSAGPAWYPAIYTAKIVVLTAGLWLIRGSYPELKPGGKGVWLGVILGPVLAAAWVLIDLVTPHLKVLGTRSAFDPFTSIHSPGLAWLFIVIRLFGITAIAPLIEELFYRSFLLRIVVNPDNFQKVPIGTYDLVSFIAVILLMASAHPEYIAAAVFSAVMNLLLIRSKNLWSTIAAHASTNFALALYVLVFHAWKYW